LKELFYKELEITQCESSWWARWWGWLPTIPLIQICSANRDVTPSAGRCTPALLPRGCSYTFLISFFTTEVPRWGWLLLAQRSCSYLLSCCKKGCWLPELRGGGLALAGHHMPTRALLSLSTSAAQGRENTTKGSWVEIRTGRDHSPVKITGEADCTWGKSI